MLEALPMRVSHLAAVATLVALLGAMFVAMGSVGAVDHKNDRTPQEFGNCVLDTGAGQTNYLLVGDSCTVATATDDVLTSSDGTIVAGATATASSTTLTALAVGSVMITDTNDAANATANDDQTIKIEVLAAPTVSITFDDNDATVKAGTPVVATITTRGFSGNHAVTVSVPSTGLVITGIGTSASPGGGMFNALPVGVTSTQIVKSEAADWPVADGSVDGLSATVTIRTTGAPEGEYPVNASVESVDVDDDTAGEIPTPPTPVTDIVMQKASTTATLTVGDPGVGLASATLSLGMRTATAQETGTDKAGGDGIKLDIESFNSLGSKANGRDINTIIVSAIGASKIAIGGTTSTQGALTVTESTASSNDVGQKHTVVVSKSTPGTVDVMATVIGASGVATTETIPLTFSGSPDTHSVAAPADALAQENDVYKPAVPAVEDNSATAEVDESKPAVDAVEGGLKFEVTGSDEADNQSALTTAQITARVLDADDKNVSSKFSITEEIKENTDGVVVIRVGTGSDKLDAGIYRLETKLTGKDTQETEFAVTGPTATVMLDVSEPDANGQFTVTATAYDADDNPVVDGTPVIFDTADQRGDFDPVLHVVRDNETTKAGVAKGMYVEIGPGRATIIVTVGDVTQIARHVSMYGAEDEEEAMPAPEMVGNHCIENKGGFAVWTCGVSAMASEVFALVQPEGATAIHLWSTISMSWVRYSVVDGTTVPGSSDFMVTENSILYISN